MAIRVATILITLFTSLTAIAHVTISPKQSQPGATQKYTMRVPTERTVPTVRIELQVPPGVVISSFEENAGWKVEPQKDASGNIITAVWSGGSIPPREAAEFSFVCRNPANATKLVWKAIQTYQDGVRAEWTGEEGTRSPAPVTILAKD